MSQIFDALQRSEAERAGDDSAKQMAATELLRNVEGQAAQKWATTAVLDPADVTRGGHSDPYSGMNAAQSFAPAAQGNAADWFQTLSFTLPVNSRLVSLTAPESPAAEAFRLLSVRLRDLRQTRPLKKLLVTSTIPKEGKSTVAANLACSLARKKEERTLLLEGDVRRPSLSTAFGLGTLPGICEWLQGSNTRPANIYHLEKAGLWILPAGKCPESPLELLQSGKLSLLMDQLAGSFDWIVVDSPPILPLADTSVWMRLVEGILLVTRQGVTEKKQLERGLKNLDTAKLVGALLNGSTASTYSSYYYQPSTASA